MTDFTSLADDLLAAKAQRTTLPSLLARHPALTPAQAYALADALAARRAEAGERSVGRKIGLTNRAVWAALETDAPIWGHVYDSTLVRSRSGQATVSLAQARAPRIEPEIGFCLRRAIDARQTEPSELWDCIDWVAPCFELIDCHFAEWKFKAVEAIADFGVHYRLVVGEPLKAEPAERDAMLAALSECKVVLSRDGNVADRGQGSNTLGHPLLALGALVRVLATLPDAQPLKAGDIITTGTLTTPQDIAAGQRWRMEVEGLALAPLELALTAAAP